MFVGMDIHKNYLQIAVLDENGKVLNNSRVENNLSKISEFFDRLDHRKTTKIVMESSGLWYSIYECHSRSAVRKCIHIEIGRRYNLIHERKWTGDTISIICKRYGVSRKTYYKWKNGYN
jgi:hypothetical protein